MNWFKNLHIRTKLYLIFGLIAIFSCFLTALSYFTIKSMNDNYSYLLNIPSKCLEHLNAMQTDYITMRYRAANFVMNTDDIDYINNTALKQYEEAHTSLNNHLEAFSQLNSSNSNDYQKINKNHDDVQKFKLILAKYEEFVQKALALSREGNAIEANKALKDAIPVINEINEWFDNMITPNAEYIKELSYSTAKSANSSILFLTVLPLILILFSAVFAFLIGSSISRPITALDKAAQEIGRGNLDLSFNSTAKDEIGNLTNSLGTIEKTIKSITSDLGKMSNEIVDGDIDARIEYTGLQGAYLETAEGINRMAAGFVGDILTFIAGLNELGNGNFNADMPILPGKKIIMNKTFDNVSYNLKSISQQINNMVNDAIAGKLSERVNVDNYKGDWAEIMKGLNRLMEAVVTPIQEAEEVLAQVAGGNFNRMVTGNYQGEFFQIKTSINEMVKNITSYIDEISDVLSALAQNNFNQSIDREYIGKFSEIKNALNNIVNKFNLVITNMSTAADQVSAGARQVSESSMTLAQGAVQQAASVENLNSVILTINKNTVQNAENAREAESLSEQSMVNAAAGDKNMGSMMAAMSGIKESSNSISRIIKVIDDIAFQTNILALNAAVEAARAGESGRGFAVVAEEVRSLAGKSKDAADETSGLIEESIKRVDEGVKMAELTAKALQTIVTDTTKVADIISSITTASQEQASGIGQVTEWMSQIASVVQDNSATSEETASASQELSSQAEMLQNLVGVFNLKK